MALLLLVTEQAGDGSPSYPGCLSGQEGPMWGAQKRGWKVTVQLQDRAEYSFHCSVVLFCFGMWLSYKGAGLCHGLAGGLRY